MGADNMMVVIERAMAAGNSVLIENMGESIDAVLNPVITRWGAQEGSCSMLPDQRREVAMRLHWLFALADSPAIAESLRQRLWQLVLHCGTAAAGLIHEV
jgi:hypothetical protein